jgi:hypothetical protein
MMDPHSRIPFSLFLFFRLSAGISDAVVEFKRSAANHY